MCGGSVSMAQEKPRQISDKYIEVTSERFERYIEEGMSFFNEHYYLGAVLSWGHALEIDPLNEEVQTLIAGALERFEELNRNLEDGFRFLEVGDTLRAYERFIYVKKNSSTKEKALYSLLERGIDEVKKRVAPLRSEGTLHFERGEFQESRRNWNALLKIMPDDEEALLYLSKISFKVREGEKLLLLARGYFDQGLSLYNQGLYGEAIDQFENAIAMNYQVDGARHYIDTARKSMRLIEDDVRKQAVELVANYLRDGIKYYNLNRYRDSLKALGEGLKIDPENTQIKEYILRSSIALKREEERDVVPASPFYRLICNFLRLGHGAFDKGRFHDSIKYFEEILLIFPQHEESRVGLTKALTKTDPSLADEILGEMYSDAVKLLSVGRNAEALAKLRMIVEVRPDFRDTTGIIERLEKTSDSSERRIREDEKRKARQYYELALDHYRNEKLMETIRMASIAVELDPEFVEARLLLSRTETRMRNLEKAASGDDRSSRGYDELSIKVKKHYLDGVQYFINGLYREAITEWKKVLELDPSNDSARSNIEQALRRLELAESQGSS